LTPGPAAVLYENVSSLQPLFGRGDDDYIKIYDEVVSWLKKVSGQDEVIAAQGSSTFAIELSAHSFIRGKVLLISTGYYSDRMEVLLHKECNIIKCKYEDLHNISGDFDWVLCAYTETSCAFKADIELVRGVANDLNAKLFLDATGSIGLESKHNLADAMAFSSCKGLFGLVGACFVAHKNGLDEFKTDNFYFNLDTHRKKLVTGPYHALASLHGVLDIHDELKTNVKKSKDFVLTKWHDFIKSNKNQPLLCTHLNGKIVPNDDSVVLYNPRSNLPGSIICHFGEIHSNRIDLENRINVTKI
jgi:2-aminoethylphosphonate-pyruvate transaminase